jgi:hypothetical protein
MAEFNPRTAGSVFLQFDYAEKAWEFAFAQKDVRCKAT